MRRGINPYNRADEIFLSFPRQFFGANDFISQFGTNLVYTAAFDPRIGSRRGTVTHAEGTYINPVVRLLRDSDSSYRSFTAPEIGVPGASVATNWVNEDVVPTLPAAVQATNPAAQFTSFTGASSTGFIGEYNNANSFNTGGWLFSIPKGCTISGSVTLSGATGVGVILATTGGAFMGTANHIAALSEGVNAFSSTLPASAGGIVVSCISGIPASGSLTVSNFSLTITSANGLIHTAYDPSGNGNDATQTTVANMPKLVDAGTLVTDALGNVAGLFDEPDYLDALSTFSIVDAFVVIEYSSSASIYPAQAISTRAAAAGMSMEIDASGNLISRIFGTLGNTTSPNIFAEEDVSQLHYAHCENANFYSSVNGNITTTNTTNVGYVSESPTPLRIGELTGGGGGGFVGKIAAIFIFNADMSSQRPAIEAALANIYGISL